MGVSENHEQLVCTNQKFIPPSVIHIPVPQCWFELDSWICTPQNKELLIPKFETLQFYNYVFKYKSRKS